MGLMPAEFIGIGRYKNICLVQKFEAKIKASSIAVYGWPLNIRRDIYPLVLVGSLAGL